MSLSNSSSTLPRKSLAQINATTASTMRSRGMSNDVNQPIAPVAPTFIPAPVSTPKEEHLENVKRLKLLVTNWFLQVCLRGKLPLERVKDLTMLYDELRDGNLLCRLLNVLHPNAITQINEAVGTISALENLSKFSGGCAAHYGVDRKYMFRPLDFFNALTKGDEGMTIFLAALAIHAVEKGYTVNFPVPEAKDLLDTIIKESESNYHLKGPIAKSSGDLLAGTNSVDNLLSSKHANRNSRNSSNAPENKNISSFRGQSTGNLLAGSAASPRDSTTSNTARSPSAIKDMVNMITGSSSPNLANRMSMSPVASPAATLTTPLTASSSIASPNSQATFTVDAAVVLPKLQKKLRKLNYNQKIILERFETALTKHNQTISQNMTQNYEQIVRKLMYAESSQKDFSEVLIDLLFQNTGINLDSNPDDLKKALEDQPDRGSIISVAPVSPPQKQFGKLPPEVLNAGLAKPEMMRLAVVYEMIDTEVDFGKDMSTLISFHKVQFKLLKLLSDDDITRVFSNTEELVSVSQSFSDKMNARKTANPFIEEIGDIIAEVSESLKAYSIYCGNYPTAMQMVSNLQSNQEVKDQIQKWMSVPETRGLSLESFLIKPIQRICKYPLLLKELLKHTEKTHKDYANLLLAAEKIEAVVKVANEATRLLGERDRIAGIQNKIDATPVFLN